MILGVTGTNGAGKGAVVEYLVKEKGFSHFSSSGYLSEKLKERGIPITRSSQRALGNEFREQFGSGYLVETFLKEIQTRGITNAVIESIRSTGEAQKLKEAGGVLLIVDANRKLRYERIFARKSEKDAVDFKTFVEQEEREWFGAAGDHDMNIQKVMDMADYKIENNGTLSELYEQVARFLDTFA